MNDIYHYFGNDIQVSVNGDLQTVNGITKGQQRILRRLLTNPGDYIYHPTYGAGLPKYVGQALSTAKYQEIKGLIQSEILKESAVTKTPAPVVKLSASQNILFVSIEYTDAGTNLPQVLNFSVTN